MKTIKTNSIYVSGPSGRVVIHGRHTWATDKALDHFRGLVKLAYKQYWNCPLDDIHVETSQEYYDRMYAEDKLPAARRPFASNS